MDQKRRKHAYLRAYTNEMPRYVSAYILEYYSGESVNTQVGYCIDIRVFLNYLRLAVFPELSSIRDVTLAHLEKVTASDLISFKHYLAEYETESRTPDGRTITRVYRNSAYGVNRKMSAVRGLFIYLYKTDQLSQNITDKIDFAKLHQKIKKPLTTQETVSLLNVIFNGEGIPPGRATSEYERRKLRDIALFTTYLGTGVRVSELVNLNIEQLDFDTSSFIVTRKGGDEQEIFMPPQVENSISEYLYSNPIEDEPRKSGPLFLSRGGGRLTVAAVERLLKNYCQIAGITHPDKTRPHALRRTFACRLLEDGVDIKMVAELMGHKNIEVTHRYYAQYSAKARRDVMEDVNLPIPSKKNENSEKTENRDD